MLGPGVFFGARAAGEGWGPRQTRAINFTLNLWRVFPHAFAFPLLRDCLGTGCCASRVAFGWVLTASLPARAGGWATSCCANLAARGWEEGLA